MSAFRSEHRFSSGDEPNDIAYKLNRNFRNLERATSGAFRAGAFFETIKDTTDPGVQNWKRDAVLKLTGIARRAEEAIPGFHARHISVDSLHEDLNMLFRALEIATFVS